MVDDKGRMEEQEAVPETARATAEPSDRLKRLMEIAERTAPLFKDGKSSKELFDELHEDETGLPK